VYISSDIQLCFSRALASLARHINLPQGTGFHGTLSEVEHLAPHERNQTKQRVPALQNAEKGSSNLQKEVDKATNHISKLAERVKKAEAGQIEAQNKLASAGVEASTARKLVEAVSPLLLLVGCQYNMVCTCLMQAVAREILSASVCHCLQKSACVFHCCCQDVCTKGKFVHVLCHGLVDDWHCRLTLHRGARNACITLQANQMRFRGLAAVESFDQLNETTAKTCLFAGREESC